MRKSQLEKLVRIYFITGVIIVPPLMALAVWSLIYGKCK